MEGLLLKGPTQSSFKKAAPLEVDPPQTYSITVQNNPIWGPPFNGFRMFQKEVKFCKKCFIEDLTAEEH